MEIRRWNWFTAQTYQVHQCVIFTTFYQQQLDLMPALTIAVLEQYLHWKSSQPPINTQMSLPHMWIPLPSAPTLWHTPHFICSCSIFSITTTSRLNTLQHSGNDSKAVKWSSGNPAAQEAKTNGITCARRVTFPIVPHRSAVTIMSI